ncbi:MAG: class I SAM-dependent methyltransferase [Halioglobus sp.]
MTRLSDSSAIKDKDKYVHGMDWGGDKVSIGDLSNYRKYQYSLVSEYVGSNILEVGSGASRSFTKEIIRRNSNLERLLSIEPSDVLFNEYSVKSDAIFPDKVDFANVDIFDLDPIETGSFDTIFYIHVLEHIEHDREALNHTADFLEEGGRVLIEVPAMPFLYSVHDEMLGHYRRYTKSSLISAVDPEKYTIRRIWYNDPIGILGSLYYFKFRKISIRSKNGSNIVEKQGMFYDKFIIPFESVIERYINFPFGLSLTAVLEKKN